LPFGFGVSINFRISLTISIMISSWSLTPFSNWQTTRDSFSLGEGHFSNADESPDNEHAHFVGAIRIQDIGCL
jgi:hypothetical protein